MEQNIFELKNKGMLRDYSISKSPDEFAFENMNVRITPNQDNTGLSVSNEKGPALCGTDIKRSLVINTIEVGFIGGEVKFAFGFKSSSDITINLDMTRYTLYSVFASVNGIEREYVHQHKSTLSGYMMFINQESEDTLFIEDYGSGSISIYSNAITHTQGDVISLSSIIMRDASGNRKAVSSFSDDDCKYTVTTVVPSGSKEYSIKMEEYISLDGYSLDDNLDWVSDDSFIYMLKYIYDSYVRNNKELPGKDVVLWDGLIGEYCGSCQTPDSLVLFTHDTGRDYIYNIRYRSNRELDVTLLYGGDLGLDLNHPVETLFHFESEDIQKVYWVDGINQPRVINIVKPVDPDKGGTQFDFISTVDKFPRIDIRKDFNSVGLFPSGTIQYGVSYYNKFGSETNLLWFSTVHYITFQDRGAKADESVSCSFRLKVLNLDNKFDYVRIYSAIRTSIDSTPIVSIVGDYSISGRKTMEVIDTNTNVTNIDPNLLNFIGGREFIAGTITSKQDRLFLGDITLKGDTITNALRNTVDSTISRLHKDGKLSFNDASMIEFGYKSVGMESESTLYPYRNQMMWGNKHFAYFKYGETYRFAIQFQTKTGSWTSPLWIGDKKCMLRPSTDIVSSRINLPTAKFVWDKRLDSVCSGYVNYRILYAETSTATRSTVAQGVLCPTVFSLKDRLNNSPYAASSWIMRPIGDVSSKLGESAYQEIQSMDKDSKPSFSQSDIDDATTGETGTVISLMFTWDIQKVKKYWAKFGGDTNVSRLWSWITSMFSSWANYKYCLVLSYSYKDGKIDEDSIAIHCESRTNLNRMWSKVRSYILENLNTDIADDMTKSQFKGLCKYTLKSVGPWLNIDDASTSDTSLAYMEKLCPPNDSYRYVNYSLWGVYRKVNQHTILNTSTSFSNSVTNSGYFVDDSIVTFHSPELEVNQDIIDNSNLKMRIVGYVPITAGISGVEMDVNTKGLVGSAAKIDLDEHYVVENVSNNYHTLVNDYLYEDSGWIDGEENIIYPSRNIDPYKIYMWHKSNSIDGLNENTFASSDGKEAFDYTPSNLKRKLFASKRFSLFDTFFDNPLNISISSPRMIYDDNTTSVLNSRNESLYYYGNVDTLLTRRGSSSGLYAKKENNGYDVEYSKSTDDEVYTKSYDPIRMRYRSSAHAVFSMTDGGLVRYRLPELGSQPVDSLPEGERYPWVKPAWSVDDDYVFVGLFNSESNAMVRLGAVVSELSAYSGKVVVCAIMYGNTLRYSDYFIVTVESGKVVFNAPTGGTDDDNISRDCTDIPMRVARLCDWGVPVSQSYDVVMLDDIHNVNWRKDGDTLKYKQLSVAGSSTPEYSYVYLAELYRDIPYDTLYGGFDENQLESLNWLVSSSPTPITQNVNTMGGDTYYQRWDCMKTYPYSEEDTNSVVDITSFMVESHLNLDGRCDINRRNTKVTLARPTNYNLFNTAYNQKDNQFRFNILDDKFDLDRFGNQVVWSNAKIDTDDIDSWTNINLLSSMSLDGSKGDVIKLENVNDNVIAFQDKAVSSINYNNPTQISTESGQPIEVVNSGLVNGFTVITDNFGCQNKLSVCKGNGGVYFIDGLKKAMVSFGKDGLSVTSMKGFSQWFKDNIDPSDPFMLYYDGITHDVYVVNSKYCLSFNEELDAFGSFYSYEGARLVFNTGGNSYMISPDRKISIYQMFAGTYGTTFSLKSAPWWVEYKVNPEPMTDKIFTNVEYTADVVAGDVDDVNHKDGYPFDRLDIHNEYQKGHADLTRQRNPLQYDNTRKFRIWRAQIPRDELSRNRIDRIRGTWAYLRLSNNNPVGNKVVLHNAIVKYFK